MRVRDHIALSTTGAVLVQPWLRGGALALWAGGVLVDVDHYLWFCVRERRISPRAAVRYFSQAHPEQQAATRVLHNPALPLALLALGTRRRALVPLAVGMLAHVALDLHHELRMAEVRIAALERDGFTCQVCGAQQASLETHVHSQPWLLPSYEAENLVALCAPCHEAVHAEAAAWN